MHESRLCCVTDIVAQLSDKSWLGAELVKLFLWVRRSSPFDLLVCPVAKRSRPSLVASIFEVQLHIMNRDFRKVLHVQHSWQDNGELLYIICRPFEFSLNIILYSFTCFIDDSSSLCLLRH